MCKGIVAKREIRILMRKVIFVFLLMMATVGVAQAQAEKAEPAQGQPEKVQADKAQAAPGKLAFEVASIRPSAPLDMAKLAAQVQAGKMPRFGARVDGSRAEYTYM